MRIALCVLLAVAGQLRPAEPDKPVVLKEDELAVLADPRSPDREKVVERYNGKVLKLTGNVIHRDGGLVTNPGNGGNAIVIPSDFVIRFPAKKAGEVDVVLRGLQWSKDPAMKKVIEQVERKSSHDRGRAAERKPVANPGTPLTVYGRLEDGKIVDVTTDAGTGGKPYKPKEKEPARLKPDPEKKERE
jgi:hypothetical protein